MKLLLVALSAAGLAVGLRSIMRGYLRESEAGELEEAEDFSAFTDVGSGRSAHAGELARLLHEWERLERARGTARFDPWALQSVRGEVRRTVQDDTALRCLFALRADD